MCATNYHMKIIIWYALFLFLYFIANLEMGVFNNYVNWAPF